MKGSKLGFKQKQIRMLSVLLSITLHFILLMFLGKTPSLAFSNLLPEPPVDNIQEKQYDRMAFELIETPPNINDLLPSSETELASDQNARAADSYTGQELAEGSPYSEGYVDTKNYPEEYKPLVPENPEEEQSKETVEADDSFLAAFKKMQKQFQEQKKNLPEPAYNNTKSSAEELGGFSFNTYDWNFAPYLLTMKKRIRNNMNLPYAFTNLGAVSGNVQIRFEVMPTGVVNKLEVLDSDAHYSLEDSSINAVQNSSAFEPLPNDFPEDRLVVTAKFSFSIIDK